MSTVGKLEKIVFVRQMIFRDLLRYLNVCRDSGSSSCVLPVAAAVLTLIFLRSSVAAAEIGDRYQRHPPAESSETSVVAVSASVAATGADTGSADENATVIVEYCRGGSFDEITVSSGSEYGIIPTALSTGQPNKRATIHNPNKANSIHVSGSVQNAPQTICCAGRNDRCWTQFFDTVCYCDEFCERRSMPDCCPNFRRHCASRGRNEERITNRKRSGRAVGVTIRDGERLGNNKLANSNTCQHNGTTYERGQETKENCNHCKCIEELMGVGNVNRLSWQCSRKTCAIRSELIRSINFWSHQPFGWVATNYTPFWGLTLDEVVRHWLGTIKPAHLPSFSVAPVDNLLIQPTRYQSEFDARTQWPRLMDQLTDQRHCGSSWIYATAGVIHNRLTVLLSRWTASELPSIEQLVECIKSKHCEHSSDCRSCQSGTVEDAWRLVEHIRVVSPSPCNPLDSTSTSTSTSFDTCVLPLVIPADHRTPCSREPGSVRSRDFRVSEPYRVSPHEQQIMSEILLHGPVQAIMEVKEDFFMYATGVYRYSLPANYLPENDRLTRHHTVTILGWGVDYSTGRPLKFWLCSNSWGKHWGENGYFRISRGTDESGIESFVLGARITMSTNEF